MLTDSLANGVLFVPGNDRMITGLDLNVTRVAGFSTSSLVHPLRTTKTASLHIGALTILNP